jgi:hypothetical protein
MTCAACNTEISGTFSQCRYCTLDERLSKFLESFITCRGSIKEVEKDLNISYPTVKNLLEELITALDFKPASVNSPMTVSQILDMVEQKKISPAEGAELIKNSRGE